MKLILKKRFRESFARKRHLCLHSNDQVKARNMKKLIYTLLVWRYKHGKENIKINKVLKVAIVHYLYLVCIDEDQCKISRPIRTLNTLITNFTESQCNLYFRFRKTELPSLLHLLRFPDKMILSNRCSMQGEEVLLRGLYELVAGERQITISDKVFGRENTQQSRAFSCFIDHIYTNFHHLVHDNLNWWHITGLMEVSAKAIKDKLRFIAEGCEFVDAPDVAHLIDCNCNPTSVCGGGPAESGANSARWDDRIQRSFYNGWKSIHGLKHQTVDNAFGMTVDMYGPASVRRNDLELLRLSNINDRMVALTNHIIFGDSAYKPRSRVRSYYHADEENPIANFVRWNAAMKKIRISIEWNYGYTATLFRYICNKQKLKILGSDKVMKVYTVATLFRNFHIAAYGGQTSNYFNLTTNFLAAYINQTDL